MNSAKERRKRRSSILKKSPSRNALTDVDTNSELRELQYQQVAPAMQKRFSKRVSFAETDQIKEFIRADHQVWHDSASDGDTSKLNSLSSLMPPIPKRPSFPLPSNVSNVQGLENLLSAPIVDSNTNASYSKHNETVGSCDMDMTNMSMAENRNIFETSSDGDLQPSTALSGRPGKASFFDNSKLDIGELYIPSSQESPEIKGGNASIIPPGSGRNESDVITSIPESEPEAGSSMPVKSVQDFLKSIKQPQRKKMDPLGSKDVESVHLNPSTYGVFDQPVRFDSLSVTEKENGVGTGNNLGQNSRPSFRDCLQQITRSAPVPRSAVNLDDTQKEREFNDHIASSVTSLSTGNTGIQVEPKQLESYPSFSQEGMVSTSTSNAPMITDSTMSSETKADSETFHAGDVTRIFEPGEDEHMEFTECRILPLATHCSSMVFHDPNSECHEDIVPEDHTKIFRHEDDGEMDFTQCNPLFTAPLPSSKTDKENDPSMLNQSKVFNAEEGGDMEMTCVTGLVPQSNAQEMQIRSQTVEETKDFLHQQTFNKTSANSENAVDEFVNVDDINRSSDCTQIFDAGGDEDMDMTNVVNVPLQSNEDEKQKKDKLGDEKTQIFQAGADEMDYTTCVTSVPAQGDQMNARIVEADANTDDKTRHFKSGCDQMDLTTGITCNILPRNEVTTAEDGINSCGDPATDAHPMEGLPIIPETQDVYKETEIIPSSQVVPSVIDETIAPCPSDSCSNDESDETQHNISVLKRKIARARNSIGIYAVRKGRMISHTPTTSEVSPVHQPQAAEATFTNDAETEKSKSQVHDDSPDVKSEDAVLSLEHGEKKQVEEENDVRCDTQEDPEKNPEDVVSGDGEIGIVEVGFNDLDPGDDLKYGTDRCHKQETSNDSDLLPPLSNDEEAIISRLETFQEAVGTREVFEIREGTSNVGIELVSDLMNEEDLAQCSQPKIARITVEGASPAEEGTNRGEEREKQDELKSLSQNSNLDQSTLRTLRKSFAESSLLDDMTRHENQYKAENISVEEFLRDFANSRIRDAHLRKARQSNIIPSVAAKSKNLPEMFGSAMLKPCELEVYEMFVQSMEKKDQWLQEEITRIEGELSAKNPEVFRKVRFGTIEESEEWITRIQKLTSQCKSLGKAYWKLDASKLFKGLIQATESHIEENLVPVVNRLGSPHDLLDAALNEIEETNRQLDKWIEDYEDKEMPPTDEQAVEYEQNCNKLDEVEKKYLEMKAKTQMESHQHSEFRKRQTELLNRILSDDELSNQKSKELEHVERSLELLQKYVPWQLKQITDRCFEFSFLSDSLVLRVESTEKIAEALSTSSSAKITYSFESRLSSDRVIPAEVEMYKLFHTLIRDQFPSEKMIESCGTSSSLSQVLKRVSYLAYSARELMHEIDWISCQVASCSCRVSSEDNSVAVTFRPPMVGVDRFHVKFFFSTGDMKSLDEIELFERVETDGFSPTSHEFIGGRRQLEHLGEDEVKQLLDEVAPGRRRLMRMVQVLINKTKSV